MEQKTDIEKTDIEKVKEIKKGKLQFVVGDATEPIGDGVKFIAHVCNSLGYWGMGFVLAISKKWREPRRVYKDMKERKLGTIDIIGVEKDVFVINMIAQTCIRSRSNPIPLRYDSLKTCLEELVILAKQFGATVHLPKIGCGLGGGKWKNVQGIIETTLIASGIDVIVYEFNNGRK